jgi:hypothetical protein
MLTVTMVNRPHDGPDRVRTSPVSPSEVVSSVTVRDGGDVRQVAIAFDRIWVATLHEQPTSTVVRAYGLHTGALVGQVTAPGPAAPDLAGEGFSIVATDRSLWVRTSTGGPGLEAYGGADNMVYEIDPQTLVATPRAFLAGDGELIAHGDRVVAVDFSHMEIRREGGQLVSTATTDELVGINQATTPGTNGLGSIHFDGQGRLLVTHEGRAMVIWVDPATGRVIQRASLGRAVPLTADLGKLWWIQSSIDEELVFGAVIDGSQLRTVRHPFPGGRNLVGRVDDGSSLVNRPYALVDIPSGMWSPVNVAESDTADVVGSGLDLRIVSWGPPDGGTTKVHLAAVPASTDQIEGTFDDGAAWAIRHDPDRGLCAAMAGASLGCDDWGPVRIAVADPTTVRWGTDGDRWLAYGRLPANALDVVVEPIPGAAPPGTVVVDLDRRLWAAPGPNPDQINNIDREYTVQYRMANGQLIDAPRMT